MTGSALRDRVLRALLTVSLATSPLLAQDTGEAATDQTGTTPAVVPLRDGYVDQALSSEKEEEPGLPFSGSFTTRYELRFTPDASDQDFFNTLSLSCGDPWKDRVSGFLFGALDVDIDGRSRKPTGDTDSTLFSINDTWQDNAHAQLYEAWVNFADLGSVQRFRVGRQNLLTSLPAWFDGASVDLEVLNRTTVTLYGGIPVDLYEASSSGDSLYGGRIHSTPLVWDHLGETTVSFEMQRYVDDNRDFGDHEDDVIHVQAWQELGTNAEVEGRIMFLEQDTSNWSVFGRAWDDDKKTRIETHYKRQVLTIRDQTDRYTEYFAILGALERFQEYGARIYRSLSDRYGIEGGFRGKKLLEGDDRSSSNADFTRYFVALDGTDLLTPGLSGSVFAELWKSTSGDEIFIGFDADYSVTDDLRLEAGTSYSEFTYETDDFGTILSLDTRRDRVRDVFLGCKCQMTDRSRIRSRYSVERSEQDTVNRLIVSLEYDF